MSRIITKYAIKVRNLYMLQQLLVVVESLVTELALLHHHYNPIPMSIYWMGFNEIVRILTLLSMAQMIFIFLHRSAIEDLAIPPLYTTLAHKETICCCPNKADTIPYYAPWKHEHSASPLNERPQQELLSSCFLSHK